MYNIYKIAIHYLIKKIKNNVKIEMLVFNNINYSLNAPMLLNCLYKVPLKINIDNV